MDEWMNCPQRDDGSKRQEARGVKVGSKVGSKVLREASLRWWQAFGLDDRIWEKLDGRRNERPHGKGVIEGDVTNRNASSFFSLQS